MDRFGEHWVNHREKLRENIAATVQEEDILLLPGDLSWALKRSGAEPDLAFLASFPGTKIVIRGNHDYWWPSDRPIRYEGLHSPPWISPEYSLGIAGTRGWDIPQTGSEDEEQDRKILERERERLKKCLAAIGECSTKIVMTHFPPHPFLPELKTADVDTVVYGHIHRGSPPEMEELALHGEKIDGITLHCVACDRINFTPVRIR